MGLKTCRRIIPGGGGRRNWSKVGTWTAGLGWVGE